MALTGDLAEFSVEQVLRLLGLSGQTGRLIVRGGAARTSIEVTRGAVTAARGEEDPEASLGLALAARAGTFAFRPGPTGNAQIDLPLDELLERARAKAEEVTEIRGAIPSDEMRFRLSERATAGTSFTVSPDELRALMAVGGGRTVREVRQQTRYGQAKTRALLYGLLKRDLIARTEAAEALTVETTGTVPPGTERARRPSKRQRRPAISAPAAADASSALAPAAVGEQARSGDEAGAMERAPIIEAAPVSASSGEADADALPIDETALREELDIRLAALSSLAEEAPAASVSVEPDPALAAVPAPDLVVVTPTGPPAEAGAAAGPPAGATVVFQLHYVPPTAQPALAPAPTEPAPTPKRRSIFDLFRLRRPAPAGQPEEVLDVPSPAELAGLANALSEEYERLADAKRQLASLPGGAFEETIPARLTRIYATRPVGARIPMTGTVIDVVAIRESDLPPAQILPYLALLIRDLRDDAERTFGRDDARLTYEAIVARAFGRTIATPTRILRRADKPLRARLTIRTGGSGGPFELRDRAYVIGRAPACDIVLGDPSISARHARLVPDLQGFRLSDLGSTNGTTVDGVRFEGERLLHSGQLIGIGDALLLYEQTTEGSGA